MGLSTETLQAYQVPFPSSTVLRPTLQPEKVTPILPTATPFFHTVVADDTLLGIAIRYGLQLDDLLNANPEINPRILSIGQQIKIPNPEGTPGALLPTATPIPLAFSEVNCYESLNRSNWCLFTVEHSNSSPVEGISAQLSIYNSGGELEQQTIVAAPHNVLPPDTAMPMGGYFPKGIARDSYGVVDLLSSFPVPDTSERFMKLDVSWVTEPVSLSTWRIRGEIQSNESNPRSSSVVSVLVSAYGPENTLVGYIKREFSTDLEPGGRFAFAMNIYSLGPSIDRVEVLAEDASPNEPG